MKFNGSFFKRLKVAEPMEKTWLTNPIISSMVYEIKAIVSWYCFTLCGEEYERQLQEALPKMPSGFENKNSSHSQHREMWWDELDTGIRTLSWKTSQRTSLTSWWMVSLWMFGFGPPCMIEITTLSGRLNKMFGLTVSFRNWRSSA